MKDVNAGHTGRLRIGIDVGGTFTDFVMADGETGRLALFKEPSTPEDPSLAVVNGLSAFLEQEGMSAADVGGLMHGTTIGLNAIIQRRGAKIGLIVSKGYRDILEIARCRMPSSFDLHASKEAPLVPRARIVEIDARMNRGGKMTAYPDDAELDRVAAELMALDLDAAALMLLNGYADAVAETDVASRLATRLNGLTITSAAAIWPEIREYERTLVACLNAYIQPLMDAYFRRLSEGLTAMGVTAPLLVTASNGGSLSVASAVARPVETILSGPASGVMAAVRQAALSGMRNIITFDMGGTSSDMAVATDGAAGIATRTDVGGLPLVLPVVDVNAIGAGGGSVVWADDLNVLKVGPHSAGAHPGPVSYGRGGTEPTITDCYIATGFIDPAQFGGGAMPLDGGAAVAALYDIAKRTGIATDAAALAEGALAVASSGMAGSLFRTMAERGLDPREFVLVPFGGAGPTQANLLADDIGIGRILVPQAAGAYCAMGAAGADLRRDFVRSLREPLNDDSATRVFKVFGALEAEGKAWLAEELAHVTITRFERSADMRYSGQAYELRVDLDGASDAADLAERFHVEHERIYDFRDAEAEIEIGTIRMAAIGEGQALSLPQATGETGAAPERGRRPIYVRGTWHEARVYDRATLGADATVPGPAIVEQPETTTVILPGWIGHADEFGNLIIERAPA